jgi:hypothetical protein
MDRRRDGSPAGCSLSPSWVAAQAIAIASSADDDPPLTGSALDQATAAALDYTGGGAVVETDTGDVGAAHGEEVRRPPPTAPAPRASPGLRSWSPSRPWRTCVRGRARTLRSSARVGRGMLLDLERDAVLAQIALEPFSAAHRNHPEGTQTRDPTSSSKIVLVDKSSQHVARSNVCTLSRPWSRIRPWVRRLELKASVGPSPVVVGDVGPKHPLQVAGARARASSPGTRSGPCARRWAADAPARRSRSRRARGGRIGDSTDRRKRQYDPRRSGTHVQFQEYSFGSIRIDGVTYDHDLIIDRGRIRKRKKAASKRFRDAYGHTPLSVVEDIPWRCRRLVIGTGADGALPVMQEVEEEAHRRKVDVLIAPTAEAIKVLNESTKGANAVLHVTC